MIVTDLYMPKMSGAGLCQWLRRQVATARIPIVAVLERARRAARRRSRAQVGADAYLSKLAGARRAARSAQHAVRTRSCGDPRPELAILLVDDSALIRASAADGTSTRRASTSRCAETFDELLDHGVDGFDLILMDVHMPEARLYGDDVADHAARRARRRQDADLPVLQRRRDPSSPTSRPTPASTATSPERRARRAGRARPRNTRLRLRGPPLRRGADPLDQLLELVERGDQRVGVAVGAAAVQRPSARSRGRAG